MYVEIGAVIVRTWSSAPANVFLPNGKTVLLFGKILEAVKSMKRISEVLETEDEYFR
jgi:hypothetical protein